MINKKINYGCIFFRIFGKFFLRIALGYYDLFINVINDSCIYCFIK